MRKARKEQLKNQMQYGELYHRNYYKEVQDKNRVYYEYYSLENTQDIPADYNEITFVCLRPDGCLETPSTLSIVFAIIICLSHSLCSVLTVLGLR